MRAELSRDPALNVTNTQNNGANHCNGKGNISPAMFYNTSTKRYIQQCPSPHSCIWLIFDWMTTHNVNAHPPCPSYWPQATVLEQRASTSSTIGWLRRRVNGFNPCVIGLSSSQLTHTTTTDTTATDTNCYWSCYRKKFTDSANDVVAAVATANITTTIITITAVVATNTKQQH